LLAGDAASGTTDFLGELGLAVSSVRIGHHVPVPADTVLHRRSLWSWFCAYIVVGFLLVLSLVSWGWVLLSPLALLVGVSFAGPTARRSVSGLALGAGFAFVFFAARSGGRSYAVPMFVMGTSLLAAGGLEIIRRTWVVPR
jgi:hypothetical protein